MRVPPAAAERDVSANDKRESRKGGQKEGHIAWFGLKRPEGDLVTAPVRLGGSCLIDGAFGDTRPCVSMPVRL